MRMICRCNPIREHFGEPDNIFSKYWEEFKLRDMNCRDLLRWLDEVGKDIEAGRIGTLDEAELLKLAIAMRAVSRECLKISD